MLCNLSTKMNSSPQVFESSMLSHIKLQSNEFLCCSVNLAFVIGVSTMTLYDEQEGDHTHPFPSLTKCSGNKRVSPILMGRGPGPCGDQGSLHQAGPWTLESCPWLFLLLYFLVSHFALCPFALFPVLLLFLLHLLFFLLLLSISGLLRR